MPSATVSWKPPDSNVRVAASRRILREERGVPAAAMSDSGGSG